MRVTPFPNRFDYSEFPKSLPVVVKQAKVKAAEDLLEQSRSNGR